MADINTISAQKILNIPRRRWKSNIEHHGGVDDVGNDFEVLKWVDFYHTIKLHNHPARLKKFCLAGPMKSILGISGSVCFGRRVRLRH